MTREITIVIDGREISLKTVLKWCIEALLNEEKRLKHD